MNRNESFLVYGMFALLALIVLVALLFGGDPASAMGDGTSGGGSSAGEGAKSLVQAPGGDDARVDGVRQLDELPGMDPARGLGNVDDANGGSGTGADVGSGGTGGRVAGGDPADSNTVPVAGAGAEVGNGSVQPGPVADRSAEGAGALGDPVRDGGAVVADAGKLGAEGPAGSSPSAGPDAAFGAGDNARNGGAHSLRRSAPPAPKTVRVGNYREVTVARGDTFSTLVVRWCGSLDAMDVAAALNETVDLEGLRTGTKILLPWVEDEVLAQKQRDRNARSVLSDVAAGKTYTVRSGDSLWVIARRQVESQRQVPGYIQRILSANPTIDADHLRVGTKLVMP